MRYLKILCLLAAACMPAKTLAEEWAYLSHDERDHTSVWLDNSSVRTENGLVKATYLISFTHPQNHHEEKAVQYRSVRRSAQFNCAQGTVRYLVGIYHGEPFGKGQVVMEDGNEDAAGVSHDFYRVFPDTIAEYLMLKICFPQD
jgi:hypothetical protein